MPLATLERSPPPFFKQGPSAFTRLMFYAALAVLLMVADSRWKMTQPLRGAIATGLQPIQFALLTPVRAWDNVVHYFSGMDEARAVQARAQLQLTQQAERLVRMSQLERENARLRALLGLRPRIEVQTEAAEILFDAPDPFTRKVVIDRGSSHGVALGSPVIDETGVLGQVTQVFPLTSEVTLVTDKDAAVPVINVRTQQRGVAYGQPQSRGMELRFMAGNADVQAGDELQTSGLDGIYPSGLPVAKVLHVERRADSAFARISLKPLSSPDSTHHVLLLAPASTQMPERPLGAASSASLPVTGQSKGGLRAASSVSVSRSGARP